jgi:hypothetical protein
MIFHNPFRTQKYMQVISVCSISLAFAFSSCLAYFFISDKFVGEKPEGFVSALLLIVWVCGLPVIMSPKKGIAVAVAPESSGGLNFVSNANIYFFSWAAFACIVYICGSYARANLKQVSEVISSVSATPKLGTLQYVTCLRVVEHVVILQSNVSIRGLFSKLNGTCFSV